MTKVTKMVENTFSSISWEPEKTKQSVLVSLTQKGQKKVKTANI